MLQTPSLKPSADGLRDSQWTLSRQGRVPGQSAGKFEKRSYCGQRTLENLSFSPVHVAMVRQSCLHLRAFPHACIEILFCAQVLLELTV